MPSFAECHACEFRDRPETCYALTTNHRRFCDLIAEGRDDYRRLVRDQTLAKPKLRPVADHAIVIPPRDRDDSRELVVAAYREDLAWLAEVPYRITVYHKGDDCPDGVPCVRLPNEKREAGTILHHVVSRYDSLAPLTVFCQGNPFDHSPDFLERIALPYDAPTTLTTRYLEHTPPAEIKAMDLVGDHHGREVRYGDAMATQYGGEPWFDPAAWAYIFARPMPRPLWFGYGATWAVPRDFILSRPRGFYADLLHVCDSGASGKSKTDPPINPWSLEALWRYIFDPSHPIRWVEPPNVVRMAGNLARATVTQMLAGNPQASDDVQSARKAICDACPLLDKERDKCNKCGCTAMTIKRAWATSECPDGKW